MNANLVKEGSFRINLCEIDKGRVKTSVQCDKRYFFGIVSSVNKMLIETKADW